MNYGKRICLNCGKGFEATYLQQVACSKECQHKRKLELDKKNQKERRAKQKQRLQELLNKVAKLEISIQHLQQVNEELAKRLEKGGSASMELKECLRCNVKGLNLPCGKNEICWLPDACEKCKEMKKPDFSELN